MKLLAREINPTNDEDMIQKPVASLNSRPMPTHCEIGPAVKLPAREPTLANDEDVIKKFVDSLNWSPMETRFETGHGSNGVVSDSSESDYEADSESGTSDSYDLETASSSFSVSKVVLVPVTPTRLAQRRSGGEYAPLDPSKEIYQEITQNPTQELAEQLAEEAIQEVAQGYVEKTIQEIVKEMMQELAEEPVQIVPEETIFLDSFGRIIGLAYLIPLLYVLEAFLYFLRLCHWIWHNVVTSNAVVIALCIYLLVQLDGWELRFPNGVFKHILGFLGEVTGEWTMVYVEGFRRGFR